MVAVLHAVATRFPYHVSSITDGRLRKAEESIAAFAFNSFKYKYGGRSFAITKQRDTLASQRVLSVDEGSGI